MNNFPFISLMINEKEYYNADDLRKNYPDQFKGCSKSVRNIIKKKDIKSNNYIYATNKGTEWKLSNTVKPSNRAKLLICADWVKKHFIKQKFNSVDKILIKDIPTHIPSILELKDTEKFRDNLGNIIDIETRGERTPSGIYFRAKDVITALKMPNLYGTIKREKSGYLINEHYKFFSFGDSDFVQKKMYITYKGMLKILFCSRSGRTNEFIDWATNTLFTVHIGTNEQKEQLVSGIIGVPAEVLRHVLKTSISSIPCIYRFALGKVKDLRKKMNILEHISDDYIIIKYGYTDDLMRRTGEHIKTYKNISSCNLELMNYVFVDPKYLSKAEVNIKNFFANIEIPLKYGTLNELVAINPKHEKTIIQHFKYMYLEYSGSVKCLTDKITELKNQMTIDKERHQWELKDKDRIIENQNLVIEKKELENKLLRLKLNNKN